MRDIPHSPSEYYIRYLISAESFETVDDLPANDIQRTLEGLGLDGLGPSYIRDLAKSMEPRPASYQPNTRNHVGTRDYLKQFKIYDMWNPTEEVREAKLILQDAYLREKLDPMLLSSITYVTMAKKLRKYTAINLTPGGIGAYGHYFWNRKLLTQSQWMDYLQGMTYRNTYVQSLVTTKDIAPQHLPYVLGISGPGQAFNSAEAAARIGQIAFKHALELEHRPATMENTAALRNCMITVEKADVIMRRSDVALRDVLKQFQKFRMKLDDARVIDVQELTAGNYSKSGEGTGAVDDEEF